MEIKQLVEIICNELKCNYNILEHSNLKEDLVYYENNVIYTRAGLPISLFSLEERTDYNKKEKIKKLYNTGNSSFDVELFIAIDSIIENLFNCSEKEQIDIVKRCKDRVRKEIINKLDFSDILDMKDLIETVKNDKYYSTLVFMVTRYECRKNRLQLGKTRLKKYTFGNIEYRRDLDIVDIEIYDDFTSIHCRIDGALTHTEETDNTARELQNAILYSIYIRNDYYYN